MPVAKTYKDCKVCGEPYQKDNGRMYVKILSGSKEKEVRWYSSSEWARMYNEPVASSVKKALGFDEGFITIFRGPQDTYNDWFKFSNARYAKWWGWYVVSTEEVPAPLPFGIESVKLYWEDVSTADGQLKNESQLKEIVDSVLFGESDSRFIGEMGQRLDLTLTVDRAIPIETNYGKSTMHIMLDDCGNEFIWTTAAKVLTVGNQYNLRGTVKNHNLFQGKQQTILTRCLIKDKLL